MRFLLKWLLFAVALYLTFWSGALLGLDMRPSPNFLDNLLMALLLGLVNALLRRGVRLALLPLNCLTLGIAGVLVNALLFWAVFALAPFNFRVGNFWAALYGSIMLGIINGLLSGVLLPDEDDEKRRR
ncbi:MAG: phage holin family protein [Fimbriimonadales bacterium]|nr:phage holin family protein [Fimbriimonadales bacterium]MDW8051494.1 phage holin family protein [Armatimonadota bacterium]